MKDFTLVPVIVVVVAGLIAGGVMSRRWFPLARPARRKTRTRRGWRPRAGRGPPLSTDQAVTSELSKRRDEPVMGSKQSRRVDGKPETAADRRFFDLRESGYTGPIDQDGNKVIKDTGITVVPETR